MIELRLDFGRAKADVVLQSEKAVLLRVAIDKKELPELHSETTVTARVHCGRRSLGFVWFHDLIEAAQSKILFWL